MSDKQRKKKHSRDAAQDTLRPPGGEPPDAAEEVSSEKEQREQIIETGSLTHRKGKHVIHCLTIVGQVEGHYILPSQNKTTKYEHVIPQLVAIEEDPTIDGLLIILNTVGGDVEAGLAIAELIAGMKKPTVSLVLGGGHSIGVPLAVSAKHSFIAPSASMTVHPVRMNGLVIGVPQTLSYFDKMQDRIVRFVCDNSGISAQRFRQLMMNSGELVMDMGTVLDGEPAVAEGLIDSLGGLHDAVSELYRQIEAQKKRTRRSAGEGGKRAIKKAAPAAAKEAPASLPGNAATPQKRRGRPKKAAGHEGSEIRPKEPGRGKGAPS